MIRLLLAIFIILIPIYTKAAEDSKHVIFFVNGINTSKEAAYQHAKNLAKTIVTGDKHKLLSYNKVILSHNHSLGLLADLTEALELLNFEGKLSNFFDYLNEEERKILLEMDSMAFSLKGEDERNIFEKATRLHYLNNSLRKPRIIKKDLADMLMARSTILRDGGSYITVAHSEGCALENLIQRSMPEKRHSMQGIVAVGSPDDDVFGAPEFGKHVTLSKDTVINMARIATNALNSNVINSDDAQNCHGFSKCYLSGAQSREKILNSMGSIIRAQQEKADLEQYGIPYPIPEKPAIYYIDPKKGYVEISANNKTASKSPVLAHYDDVTDSYDQDKITYYHQGLSPELIPLAQKGIKMRFLNTLPDQLKLIRVDGKKLSSPVEKSIVKSSNSRIKKDIALEEVVLIPSDYAWVKIGSKNRIAKNSPLYTFSIGGIIEEKYKFKECAMGDLLHLIFENEKGKEIDFGHAGELNNLGSYEFCAEESNEYGAYTSTNKSLIGKIFNIKWKMKGVMVYTDPPDWDKTDIVSVPSIVAIDLHQSDNSDGNSNPEMLSNVEIAEILSDAEDPLQCLFYECGVKQNSRHEYISGISDAFDFKK